MNENEKDPQEGINEETANNNPTPNPEEGKQEIPETPLVTSTASVLGINPKIAQVKEKVFKAQLEFGNYVIGQDDLLELMLVGIFTNGHILLEGVPGIAKTLTAKVLAKSLSVDFARIQFTPDLMPSDVIGTNIYSLKTSEFEFKKGPIFSNIVLIDEINRAPAKTQAALFEVMEERQITYDGHQYNMEFPFLVMATQNPVEQEGTYNLPEAQLDRFLFKVKLKYPSLDSETQILKRYQGDLGATSLEAIQKVFTANELKEVQDIIKEVKVEDQILKYIAEITNKTRNHGQIYLGASPRASLSMMKAAKALAAIKGRDFVIPEDVQKLANHIYNHRIILSPEAEMEGLEPENVIEEIIRTVEVPR
ncbi:MAG: MoxR family ATPase [Crocinitomicaceae bacterium]|nr:MoxR family ATPase [Crocinitomicaceae bacterium]